MHGRAQPLLMFHSHTPFANGKLPQPCHCTAVLIPESQLKPRQTQLSYPASECIKHSLTPLITKEKGPEVEIAAEIALLNNAAPPHYSPNSWKP